MPSPFDSESCAPSLMNGVNTNRISLRLGKSAEPLLHARRAEAVPRVPRRRLSRSDSRSWRAVALSGSAVLCRSQCLSGARVRMRDWGGTAFPDLLFIYGAGMVAALMVPTGE